MKNEGSIPGAAPAPVANPGSAEAAILAKVRPTTKNVLEALTRSAGDVLMRSKLSGADRTRVANGIIELSTKFGELTREAWGGEG